jgi:hypothetical protein
MTTTATRDQVLDTEVPNGFYATTDQGGYFRVLGRAGTDQVFALSAGGTGLVVLVTRTGNTLRGGQVRVRFDFPTDSGDQAGTLAFGPDHTGGVAPLGVFDL